MFRSVVFGKDGLPRGGQLESGLGIGFDRWMRTGSPFDEDFFSRLENLQILFRKRLEGMREGDVPTGKIGGAVEFADRRTYSSSDRLRDVDWKVYLRTERLFVKQYTRQEAFAVAVLLDTSASMMGDKLLQAKRIAGALSCLSLAGYHSVSVGAFNEEVAWFEAKSLEERGDVLEFIAGRRPAGRTMLGSAVMRTLERIRVRSLILIVSDFLTEEKPARWVRLCGERGYDVVFLQVLSAEERNPSLRGELLLRDVETGETCSVVLDEEVKGSYLRALGNFLRSCEDAVRRAGGRYYLVSADEPFDRVVKRYLMEGGLIG